MTKWVRAYAAQIRDYINQYGAPELIHAHTYLGAMVALELQNHIPLPYIVTAHYTGWMDGSIRRHHKALGIAALNGAKKVLAVSRSLKDSMQPMLKQEIEICPNFIDFEVFKSDASQKSNDFEILGVGDLIPRKQWGHLIQAYAAIYKDLGTSKLTIIGDGPLMSDLEKLIKELNMESYVHLVGRKSKQEVAQAMQRSSVIVHTSRTETFGLIYLEALACGLPVISYDNGGVNEFRGMKNLEIIPNQKQELLKTAIQISSKSFNQPKVTQDVNNVEGIKRYTNLYNSIC